MNKMKIKNEINLYIQTKKSAKLADFFNSLSNLLILFTAIKLFTGLLSMVTATAITWIKATKYIVYFNQFY